jgi:hypothetical protein
MFSHDLDPKRPFARVGDTGANNNADEHRWWRAQAPRRELIPDEAPRLAAALRPRNLLLQRYRHHGQIVRHVLHQMVKAFGVGLAVVM